MIALYRDGKLSEAVEVGQPIPYMISSVLGHLHPSYASSLNNFADILSYAGHVRQAEMLYKRALAIRKDVLSEQHPVYAETLTNLARLYDGIGNYAEAGLLQREALEIFGAVLGEQHPSYALGLNNLGALHLRYGEYSRAAVVFTDALEIRKAVHGERHRTYARSLCNLGDAYRMLGEYTRAELILKEALDIQKAAPDGRPLDYADSLNGLAVLYLDQADYARAAPLLRECHAVRKSVLGTKNISYAHSLNNLALLYTRMGDFEHAEDLYREALETQKSVPGKNDADYASMIGNLAGLFFDTGDFARAETLFRQALELRTSVWGEQHPETAGSLSNLAAVYLNQGDMDRADRMLSEALEIWRSDLGEQHPNYADGVFNMASLWKQRGDLSRAAELFSQSLAAKKSAFGENHPEVAEVLIRLASVHFLGNDFAQAQPLFEQAVEIQRDLLDNHALIQSARLQTRNQEVVRQYLDCLLVNTTASGSIPSAEVLMNVWRWKGAVTRRQHVYRELAAIPQVAESFVDLQSVVRQLSSMLSQQPPLPDKLSSATEIRLTNLKHDVWNKRFSRLTARKEELEQQIAFQSEEYHRLRKPLTVAQVRRWLPKNTAFVELLEYVVNAPTTDQRGQLTQQRRFIAFVVRTTGQPAIVELGSVEKISAQIVTFRRSLTVDRPEHDKPAAATTGRRLREQLWRPIEEHLDGIETVIISPDTTLGTLPWAALPGKKKSSYLVEDYRIATLPMATQMWSLFEDDPPQRSGRGLLVLGDVDYDHKFSPPRDELPELGRLADSSQREVLQLRSGNSPTFTSLPGFRREFELVSALFRARYGDLPITTLSRSDATEARFLQQAANARVVHVVTHGYFADPTVKSIHQATVPCDELGIDRPGPDPFTNTHLPGLLSGLAMAGANNPSTDPDDPRDGILRASEIEAASLQGVDLVVLSACETGLGKVAGGEGLTGLQRAFQIAGARSVIASLWKVEDAATTELMRLFYENLWERKLSKLDALREAQLTMLNRYDAETGQLRGSFTGRKQTINPNKPAPKADTSEPLSPRYWAAFQLSGDWR